MENKQISDKLKQFLISEYKKKTFLSDKEINEKINWYSTLEYNSLFEEMEECSDGCFEIDKEEDGWYGFISEPHHGIEIGPYNTYEEALECATIAAIKRIYMKKELNFSQELYKPQELQ